MVILTVGVLGSKSQEIDETWGGTANANGIDVFFEEDSDKILNSFKTANSLWYLAVNGSTFVNIPSLISYLQSLTVDDPTVIGGGCENATAVLYSKSALTNPDYKTIVNPNFRGCDYLGKIGGSHEHCCSCEIMSTLVCENMSPSAMETFQIALDYKPRIHKTPSPDSGWTFVTAFFDLTSKTDVTSASRSLEHYMNSSHSTMALNENLVIFCEPKMKQFFEDQRASYGLLSKTLIITMEFEDTPLHKYHSKITQNRIDKPYHFDLRNNPSYFLFCISRCSLIKSAIENNHFKSTHFAWINICLQRMGLRNIEHLVDVVSTKRDKFSTLYIDYQPKSLVSNLPEYYQWGRCGMCSGFYTGNTEYMWEFCDRMEKKFIETVEAGYGHADEQLFSQVYFDDPSIFEFYYGDYQQMVTNYKYIRENVDITLRLLIPKSREKGDHKVCLDACKFVLSSLSQGTIRLRKDQLISLMDDMFMASYYLKDKDSVLAVFNILTNTCKDEDGRRCLHDRRNFTIKNSDWGLEFLPKLKNLRCHKTMSDKMIDFWIKSGYRVFIYSEEGVRHESFINNNPIRRPNELLLDIKYDMVIP
jgi:hypothetical protein